MIKFRCARRPCNRRIRNRFRRAGQNPMVGGAAISDQEHRRKCHEVEGSRDARGRRQGSRPGLDARGGPFTVFAPTNEAFAALPAGTVDTLLKPENKAKLVKDTHTCHVVAAGFATGKDRRQDDQG